MAYRLRLEVEGRGVFKSVSIQCSSLSAYIIHSPLPEVHGFGGLLSCHMVRFCHASPHDFKPKMFGVCCYCHLFIKMFSVILSCIYSQAVTKNTFRQYRVLGKGGFGEVSTFKSPSVANLNSLKIHWHVFKKKILPWKTSWNEQDAFIVSFSTADSNSVIFLIFR